MEQDDLLRLAAETLDRLNTPYMLVGSYGSSVFGEPRFTQDIDIVLDLSAAAVPVFCRAFPPPDFYLSEQSIREAVRDRFQFNVLHLSSGNKVDFIFPKSGEWGGSQLSRRRRVTLEGGSTVAVACPEDVILGKLWYYSEGGSDKHLRDIAGILRVSGELVDRADVTAWATKLGYLDTWTRILESVDDPTAPRV